LQGRPLDDSREEGGNDARSADGRTVFYRPFRNVRPSAQDSPDEIVRTGADGGTASLVYRAWAVLRYSLSPDGKHLAVSVLPGPREPQTTGLVPAHGGAARWIFTNAAASSRQLEPEEVVLPVLADAQEKLVARRVPPKGRHRGSFRLADRCIQHARSVADGSVFAARRAGR
jgi:hypothetical protein